MSSWREIQRTNFTKISDLISFLEMSEENAARILKLPRFPLNLPLRLARKMAKNSLTDPIFLQFVPLDLELKPNYGKKDPTEDHTFQLTPRLLKKYPSRVLMMPTSACAMHCRYCFRQNYNYETNPSDLREELSYIQNDASTIEVILSGGDPLSLSDEKLLSLLDQLLQINHLRIIRFHSRFLVGIPERLTEELLLALKKSSKQIVFVFHINHPLEIDSDLRAASRRLREVGVQTLNQSTLLKGVNDTYKTLKELCLSLVEAGIIPYYLHSLDPVEGAAHFEVETQKGSALIEELRATLPGYSIPRFVQEIPHKNSKTPI